MSTNHDRGAIPEAIILGCVATKRPGPAQAKDLYDSPMFAKRRRYAESTGKPWFIFSAKHGILDPDEVVDWEPMVEGVAPDDYDESGTLLSLLRMGGSAHLRELTEVPIGYAGFTIVRQSDEIVAKYGRNSLAVKILEDDLPGWARHAIVRSGSKESR